jgi:hypothetical protein
MDIDAGSRLAVAAVVLASTDPVALAELLAGMTDAELRRCCSLLAVAVARRDLPVDRLRRFLLEAAA